MTTAQAAEQQSFDLGAYGGQHSFQTGVGEELIAMAMPLLEQPLRLLQQVFAQLFRGGRSGVDQVLEVAQQMIPAPPQPLQPPIHFRPLAADHACKLVGQQFVEHGGLADQSATTYARCRQFHDPREDQFSHQLKPACERLRQYKNGIDACKPPPVPLC